jgi:hypothetical protein
MVLSSLLPHFPPTVIADGIAQREHGIDIFALPMHPRPFETSLDDILVGTLHHPRTNGPALLSKCGILHQCISFPQVVQVLLDAFLLG